MEALAEDMVDVSAGVDVGANIIARLELATLSAKRGELEVAQALLDGLRAQEPEMESHTRARYWLTQAEVLTLGTRPDLAGAFYQMVLDEEGAAPTTVLAAGLGIGSLATHGRHGATCAARGRPPSLTGSGHSICGRACCLHWPSNR